MLDYTSLKQYQRAHRDHFNPDVALRIHRALSWFNRAQQETDDLDARFTFYWISFNAAYGVNAMREYRMTESETFSIFIRRLVDSDKDALFQDILWQQFPNAIRILLSNQFVYQPFWDELSGEQMDTPWKEQFDHAKRRANIAFGHHDVSTVLGIILNRLYTLRNQIIHGGATWNSQVNREQLRDANNILGELLPVIIHIMMMNANQVWGPANYPVVKP